MKNIKQPLVSIIIPLYVICDRFFSDLKHFDKIKYSNYEILVICDKKIKLPNIQHLRLIITGLKQTGPAEKRDIGLKQAKGTICAFIDDDAYPNPLWIKTAMRHFVRNKDVIAVGGPGVTPPDDGRMAQLGGLVYTSAYTSGQLKMRFVSMGERTRVVEDWPAYNLFIRTDMMKKVGGWGSTFYGGEDTYICSKMLKYGRMIYDPRVIVYHHRRPLFFPHMKQIFNVGMHRGYFFKRYPETSRYALYLLPTTLTVGFWTLFILSLFNPITLGLFLLTFGIFFGIALSTVLNRKDPFGTILASLGIIMTHMAYGVGFIKGLLTEKLLR
ncbi:glycosyltransferase family 2 protein [Patescibacteria group bacterium]|nr:glycosyltransferase family 2 protein [Patescibacteria group bacterium]MBU1472779.1 glycosyltransferase family 2 protein [Patescibacteria group bacterium]MBU2460045.1 glycosyltransferase family 2 protein [Patescibacteria group bacterium]MBU2544297.1 glycosyltransferase family 2 protein [Patescibacteria group bacterium]